MAHRILKFYRSKMSMHIYIYIYIYMHAHECYFCGKDSGYFHEITYFRLNRRVRCSAFILIETEQTHIRKLSREDMIVPGAKNHVTCAVDLYRRVVCFQQGSSYSEVEKQAYFSI